MGGMFARESTSSRNTFATASVDCSSPPLQHAHNKAKHTKPKPTNRKHNNPKPRTPQYVPQCKDESKGCRKGQVPAFYLRSCPRGTQMINTSAGALAPFQTISQMCYSCGPMNYIVDPHSGGTCQECPKGALCPDGDLFLPIAEGSEWVVERGTQYDRAGLDQVYRLVSCPAGWAFSRDDRYPLEDRCLRCEPGTYLLDQSNFSACVRCPIGATCSGGASVVANAGFWREPDNWSNPLLANVSESGDERRRKWWLAHYGAVRRSGDDASANATNATVRRMPRRAILHRCNPGSCSPNNTCLKGFVGPACGLCPEGWAKTSAGCEWCPAADDPSMLLLKIGVYGVGGLLAMVAYIFACWTPLMGNLVLPAFLVSALMLYSGVAPEQETEAQEEEMDEEAFRHDFLVGAANSTSAHGTLQDALMHDHGLGATARLGAMASNSPSTDEHTIQLPPRRGNDEDVHGGGGQDRESQADSEEEAAEAGPRPSGTGTCYAFLFEMRTTWMTVMRFRTSSSSTDIGAAIRAAMAACS